MAASRSRVRRPGPAQVSGRHSTASVQIRRFQAGEIMRPLLSALASPQVETEQVFTMAHLVWRTVARQRAYARRFLYMLLRGMLAGAVCVAGIVAADRLAWQVTAFVVVPALFGVLVLTVELVERWEPFRPGRPCRHRRGFSSLGAVVSFAGGFAVLPARCLPGIERCVEHLGAALLEPVHGEDAATLRRAWERFLATLDDAAMVTVRALADSFDGTLGELLVAAAKL